MRSNLALRRELVGQIGGRSIIEWLSRLETSEQQSERLFVRTKVTTLVLEVLIN